MNKKHSNGKVSIIIPAYNTEKYIERCIHSLLNQTYTNLEIICVDDGSTDDSGAILDNLEKADSRIKVIHKKNEGVTAARNAALRVVSGDYIGFVDSDDYVEREMFESMVEAIEANNVDIVTCSYYFDYAGTIKAAANKEKVPSEKLMVSEFLPYMYERDVYPGVASYLWTRLFRRNIIIDDKGTLLLEFQPEFGGADDIVFVAEANLRSSGILYLDKPLYYYFQRENSFVHDSQAQLATLHWIKAYEKVLEIYEANNISATVIELIKRMYVYRCGKILELALEMNDEEKITLLREKIRRYLLVYFSTNLDHLDRIEWIVGLLLR